MGRDENIIELYFTYKMKQKEIAEKLHISKYIVSRVVSKDIRYSEEKQRRKAETKRIHNERKVEAIIKKRKNKSNEYAILKNQHLQASFELSGRKSSISNRTFRDWNSSAYKYDNKTKTYKLRKNIVAGADVPKQIKW